MFDAIAVKRADVARLVNATFPEYRGRKIKVEIVKHVTLHDLNWAGGSRNVYRSATVSGESLGSSSKYAAMAPWNNPAEGTQLPVPAGFIVVRHGMFQGRDVGLMIYVNPADETSVIPKALAA